MKKLALIAVSATTLAFGSWGMGGCSSSDGGGTTPPPDETAFATLTVVVTGVGAGAVSAVLPESAESEAPEAGSDHIDCRKGEGVCSARVEEGSDVTLTAAADEGFVFLGWYGGACEGVGDCVVTVDEARTVRAAFAMVAFFSTSAFDGSDALSPAPTRNLFVMKTDGTDRIALTASTHGDAFSGVGFPKWSPDGEKLVFSANGLERINDNAEINVWVADLSGGFGAVLRNLTGLSHVDHFSPQWSPDGLRIAFTSDRRLDGSDAVNDNGTRNLWIMNADGSDPRPLTQTKADFTDVKGFLWSPRGDRIFFASSRDLDLSDHSTVHFTENVWEIAPDATGLRPLTGLTVDFISHFIDDVSADGGLLLLESSRHIDGGDQQSVNGVTNLWLLDTESLQATPLTRYTAAGAFVAGPPIFSADGSKAFYATNGLLDGSDAPLPLQVRNIWSVALDGTGAVPLAPLTVFPAFQTSLDFAPDGSRLFFASDRHLSGDDVAGGPAMNVWSMNPDGSDLTPLTELTAPNIDQRSVTVSR